MRVMVVEDEVLLCELLIEYFKIDPEFEVIGWACDGEAAIEKIVKLAPEMVILDIRMPKIDGLEVLRFIQRQIPGTKVVVFSGTLTEDCLASAAEHGVEGFVGKAYGLKELRKAMGIVAQGGKYSSENICYFMQEQDPAYSAHLKSDSSH